MSNLTSFNLNLSTATSGTINVGNVSYATASFVNSGSFGLTWGEEVYAVDGYTFITDSYTQSLSPSSSANPLFYLSTTTNSVDILNVINRLPDRVNQTSFTNKNTALNWVSGSGKYVTLLNGGLYTGSISYTALSGSLVFNGTNQFLSMSPGMVIGAGAYTVEGWFYNNSTYATQKGLMGTNINSGMHLFSTSNSGFSTDKDGGLGARSYSFPSSTLETNKWQYIIINRNASTLVETMWVGTFVDTDTLVTCNRATSCAGGTSISGGTQVNNLNFSGASNWVARFYGGYFPGYITNFRVTIGTAVYNSTSSTVTAPNAPLTSLANTKYLMLGAVVTTDSSGTQTVTNNNTVTQNSALKPF